MKESLRAVGEHLPWILFYEKWASGRRLTLRFRDGEDSEQEIELLPRDPVSFKATMRPELESGL